MSDSTDLSDIFLCLEAALLTERVLKLFLKLSILSLLSFLSLFVGLSLRLFVYHVFLFFFNLLALFVFLLVAGRAWRLLSIGLCYTGIWFVLSSILLLFLYGDLLSQRNETINGHFELLMKFNLHALGWTHSSLSFDHSWVIICVRIGRKYCFGIPCLFITLIVCVRVFVNLSDRIILKNICILQFLFR